MKMTTDCLPQPTRESGDRDEPGSSAEGDGPPEPSDRPAPHPIEIRTDDDCVDGATVIRLQRHLAAVCPHLPRPVQRIAVRIVEDDAMIALHGQWHQDNTTTDVITFESSTEGPLEVDLAICADEAARAAASRAHGFEAELLLYAVHGLLHCCGHNDHTDADAAAMHQEEDRLLVAIGHPPVFRDGATP